MLVASLFPQFCVYSKKVPIMEDAKTSQRERSSVKKFDRSTPTILPKKLAEQELNSVLPENSVGEDELPAKDNLENESTTSGNIDRMTRKVTQPFNCNQCNASYTTVRDLRAHLKVHTGEFRFVCEYCQKGYKTKPNLLNHVNLHTGEGLHTCDVCSKVFTSLFLLNRHKRWHVEGFPYPCKLCDKKFKVTELLRAHEREHSSKRKRYKCEICPKQMSSQKRLEDHMVCHRERSKETDCEVCGRKFQTVETLRRHMNIHTKKRFYPCDKCDEVFFQPQLLCHHRKRAHPHNFGCIYCKEKFESQEDLDVHVESHRKDSLMKCHVCDGTWLQQHRHRKLYWDTVSAYHYTCHHYRCVEQFHTLDALIGHLHIHEPNPEANICSCDICGQRFATQTHMKNHLIRHSVVKKSKCNSCDQEFPDDPSLMEHVKTHIGEVPFLCHHCGQSLSSDLKLKNHLTRHSGEKTRFVCLHCPLTFSGKAPLTLHMRSHGKARFFCEKCGRYFNRKTSFEKHKSSHFPKPVDTSFHDPKSKTVPFQNAGLIPNNVVEFDGFICSKCTGRFQRFTSLTEHMAIIHDDKKFFLCNMCRWVFSEKALLLDHLLACVTVQKKMKPNEPIPRHNQEFPDDSSLKEHVQTHIGEVPFLCHHCGQALSSDLELKSHLAHHSGENFRLNNKPTNRQSNSPNANKSHPVPLLPKAIYASLPSDTQSQIQPLNNQMAIPFVISQPSSLRLLPNYIVINSPSIDPPSTSSDDLSPIESLTIEVTLFRCTYCTCCFSKEHQLMEHLRLVHSSTAEPEVTTVDLPLNCKIEEEDYPDSNTFLEDEEEDGSDDDDELLTSNILVYLQEILGDSVLEKLGYPDVEVDAVVQDLVCAYESQPQSSNSLCINMFTLFSRFVPHDLMDDVCPDATHLNYVLEDVLSLTLRRYQK